MQRTNPLQNRTADEEQGALLAAEGIPLHKLSAKADGDAIQRNGLNIRTHAPALKRLRPVRFGLPLCELRADQHQLGQGDPAFTSDTDTTSMSQQKQLFDAP